MAAWLIRLGDWMAIGFAWFYKGLGVVWVISLLALGLAWAMAHKQGP